MPRCKEKSAARSDTLRAFLTPQAGIFYQKHRRKPNVNRPCYFIPNDKRRIIAFFQTASARLRPNGRGRLKTQLQQN